MIGRRQFLLGTASAFVMGGTPAIVRAQSVKPGDADVLVITDVQNCFLPGGTLPVPDGDKIISIINRLGALFRNVVMTQDWHTPDHISFASAHPGKKPFEMIKLDYGDQILWPDHCVQGTSGADIAKDVSIPHAQLVVRKGFHRNMDSYSGFFEADHKTPTGLGGYLTQRGINKVFVAGLATDFCVAWTAVDARNLGFETYVVEDACRGIDTQGSLEKAWADMLQAGVKRITSADLA